MSPIFPSLELRSRIQGVTRTAFVFSELVAQQGRQRDQSDRRGRWGRGVEREDGFLRGVGEASMASLT